MAGQERILNIENNVDALVWWLRLIESANDLFLGNYIDSYNEDTKTGRSKI